MTTEVPDSGSPEVPAEEPSPEFVAWAKEAMEAEIAGARTTVVIGPWSAFELIGALQMVTRHPEVPESLKNHMRQFGNQFSDWYKGTPAEEVLRRGWDPRYDVDRDGRRDSRYSGGEHVWSSDLAPLDAIEPREAGNGS